MAESSAFLEKERERRGPSRPIEPGKMAGLRLAGPRGGDGSRGALAGQARAGAARPGQEQQGRARVAWTAPGPWSLNGQWQVG